MLLAARSAESATLRTQICRFRAVSVSVLLGVTGGQLAGGVWKRRPYAVIVSRFALLALIYAYLGFVRPETEG